MAIKKFIPPYKTMYISVKNLISTQKDYQRDVEEDEVAKIVADFDSYLYNEPKVSLRDGQYYIIDGQHTVSAMKKLFGENIHIPCKVANNLDDKKEAMLCALQTGHSRPTSPADRIRSWLFCEDKDYVDFQKATESAGFTLALKGSTDSPCQLHCLNTAFKLYQNLGESIFREALFIIAEAWEGDPDSLKADIIKGVIDFVGLYSEEINRYSLIKALHSTDPVTLRRSIISDFDYPGNKRGLHRIYTLYCETNPLVSLPVRF